MRFDGNSWQEGAGLFIKKAGANPYSVVAAYLGELEKIASATSKNLEEMALHIFKKLQAGETLSRAEKQAFGALREREMRQAAKGPLPVGGGDAATGLLPDAAPWMRSGHQIPGRATEMPRPNAVSFRGYDRPPRVHAHVSPAEQAAFDAAGEGAPMASRPDVPVGGGDDVAGLIPRGAWSKVGLAPESLPENARFSREPSVRLGATKRTVEEADRPTSMGRGAEDVDRPTSVSMQAQDFLGQADALTQASAEAARKGDFEGSRRLAVQASSFEREFESISQARRGQALRAGPSVEQVRGGEPTAARAQDPRTAIQAGRKQVTDATVVERPRPEVTTPDPAVPIRPNSAVSPRTDVVSEPPSVMDVRGEGRAARVQVRSREVVPEGVGTRPKSMDDVMGPSARSSPEEALAQGRITQQQYDSMRPQAAAEAKSAYVPPPVQPQNVMFGSAADGGTVSAQEAVQTGRLKASDPQAGTQPAGLTSDPPAQMAPQPVDAPSTPMGIQQGANSPMTPTPEAPVAVAPVWKRRAALAGAGTLAAGGAFAAGYGGRQVIQPQQGQR